MIFRIFTSTIWAGNAADINIFLGFDKHLCNRFWTSCNHTWMYQRSRTGSSKASSVQCCPWLITTIKMEAIFVQVQHHLTVALLLSESKLVTSYNAAPLPVDVLSPLELAWYYLCCAPTCSTMVKVPCFLDSSRTSKVSSSRAFLFHIHKYRDLKWTWTVLLLWDEI